VHVGLQLDHAGAGVTAARVRAQARHAEEHGFDSVWLFDHVLTPVTLTSTYPYDTAYPLVAEDPFLDPLGIIGVLAGATSRIQIGTQVIVAPYRHPIVLGKVLATIEQFAPGRLICGLGSGWMREEFDALDVPFAGRGVRMDEYVAALRTVWSGTPAAYDGTVYRWDAAGFNPAPTRPIPILLGGHAAPARARALRLGDGWATILTALEDPSLAGSLAWLRGFRDELESAGRDPAAYDLLVCEQPLLFADRPDPAAPLSGPPEAVAEAIVRLRDAGVTKISLLADDAAVERFAAEVRPLL
jgi:probable F420-dependent oxidoreductase